MATKISRPAAASVVVVVVSSVVVVALFGGRCVRVVVAATQPRRRTARARPARGRSVSRSPMRLQSSSQQAFPPSARLKPPRFASCPRKARQMRRSPDGGRGFVVTVCRRAAAGSRSRMEIGYALSSEEHEPLELVRNAVRAEKPASGTRSSPTTTTRGSTAKATVRSFGASWAASLRRRPRSGSALGDDCPLIRIHPAIVAQAAATSAAHAQAILSASGPART